VIVQIYGLTVPEDAHEIDRLGADSIGIVLDEGIPTWDSVDEETARSIASAITRTRVVALSLSTDPDRILHTVRIVGPDIVHLALAGAIDTAILDQIRKTIAPAELMLTVPVEGIDSISLAQRLSTSADYLLLDTVHPETGVLGASGRTHDWTHSSAIVQEVDVAVVLAGGLGPDNVSQAISEVQPAGVDSETNTSKTTDRRRKDLLKVETFISLAKQSSG
jgi:phosphoribosylanthranilate isomerase